MPQLWLDLEETIINNWHDSILINQTRIRNWLDKRNIDNINIWSFAIYNQKDQNTFVRSHLKERIENVLQRNIISYPSIIEMRKFVYEYERIHYDDDMDFVSINGKHWSFIKFCLGHYPNDHCILIDDCIPTMTVNHHKNQGVIELINIVDI